MAEAILLLLLSVGIGVGSLFVAFNSRARKSLARQSWMWKPAKNEEEEQLAEDMAIVTPLIIGVICLSLSITIFLVWLLT